MKGISKYRNRFILAAMLFVLLLSTSQQALAAVRTWDGGGADNNWSTAANWSDNTKPVAGDTATFDSTSLKVCTIDAAATVANFFLSSAYTGTISQEANLAVTSTFTQEGNGIFKCLAPQTYTFTSESFSISNNSGKFFRFTGSGTSGSPYMIYDVFGLQAMKQYRNNVNINFKLNQNIDAAITSHWNAGVGFVPVGTVTSDIYSFSGKFYGNSKTISGLHINRPSENYIGLFGYTFGSTIQDVGIIGGSITGNGYVGELVGRNDSSTISNSYATGNVTGNAQAGGLVGLNYSSTINNSYATGSVGGSNLNDGGGLAGYCYSSTINNSYATGNLISGTSSLAGLVGNNDGSNTISNCYATGNVSGNNTAGGLVGRNTSSAIIDSYATGDTTGGGLVGTNSGTITGSYFCGSPDNGLGTSVTTAQLKQKATFSGWDFKNFWLIDENKSYPYHTWEAWNTVPVSWTTTTWKKNLVVQGTYPQTNSDKVFISTGESTTVPSGTTLGGLQLGTGAGTVTLGGVLTLDNAGIREGTLAIYGGTLNAGSYTINVDGNFSHNGGVFTQGTSTVLFESTTPSSIEGNTTFHNFTCTSTNKPLSFEAGAITTIESGGVLTLTGSAGNLITLRSTSDGWQWKINPSGTRSVSYVDVKDSNNINATLIDPTSSTNSGNNTNWFSIYTLTSEVIGSNGAIAPSGTVTTESGINNAYTITANSGYYIRDIKVDSVSLTGEAFGSTYSYTFEAVSANHTIQASFEVNGLKVWDGGGTTNYWKDQNNWTGNATPEVTDTATFDSTSQKVCTIDAAATVANFFLSSAYTGTVSQNANMAVTSTFTQEGLGTFECVAPQTYAFTSESFSISTNSGTFMRFTGAGTAGSPYMIYDVFALQSMKQYLNDPNINFKLNQNIDAAITSRWNGGAGFVPVGTHAPFTPFAGEFYGNNKTINGLYINRPAAAYTGLFGYVYGSTIQDVGIIGGSVSGSIEVGGLVGYNTNSSTISNSYATGSVSGTGHTVGGLVGENYYDSQISNSYATGSVSGTDNFVGGLVGSNYSNCAISNSYATGSVNGNNYAGGLVGFNSSTSAITNSYATGSVSGTGDFVGGLVGFNNSTSAIINSYATGSISGSSNVGGLVGENYSNSQISNSYATGSVNGNNYAGGLVGYNNASNTISNSYATGLVSGSGATKGGLVGDNTSSTITSSYYDTNTTGQSDTGKGTPETTAQMKNKYTFTNWDWDNAWGIKNGQAYPTLQWQGHIWYGGVDNNWSTSGNWNKASVPGAIDMVYFNSSSTSDATADTSFGGSIAGLSIGAGYANTLTLGKNLSIGNDLYQNAGTLNCASYTVTISGGISHEAGTFTDGTGSVIFIDATRISTIEGNTTFNNLTCATAGKMLTFEASQITTAEGVLTLTGSAGNLITLRSTSDGTQWKINPSGTRSVSYVDVKDSNNINATVIGPTSSTNSGNNTNWFQTAPAVPTNFVPTSESTTALHYTWTDNATNESGFRILDGTNEAIRVAVAAGETATSESGLAANTQYSRKIQVYNADGAATSDAASKYTSIEAATGASWEGITTTSITIHASNEPSNLSSASSGMYFENVSEGTNSGWISSNTWTSLGLTMDTAYSFRITTRNGDGVMAATLDAGSKRTSPEEPVYIPSADAYSNIFTSKITANWKANGNPDGTQYYCENTVNGNNSGWITLLTWKDSGLTASTVYAFRVKAKSSLGTQSEWADLGRQETKGLSTFSSIKENGVNLLNNDIVKNKPALEVRAQSTSDILTSTFKTWIDDIQINDAAISTGGYDSISSTGKDITFYYTPKTALTTGMHKVKFEVYDDEGTIFREERAGLTVKSESGITGAVLSYPNPADPSKGPVKISYNLNTDSSIVLYLFDTTGRLVWKQIYSEGSQGGKAGYNEVVWDGKDIGSMTLPNDVYLLRVMEQSSGRVLGKSKIVILRSSSAKPDNNSFAGVIALVLFGLVGAGGMIWKKFSR